MLVQLSTTSGNRQQMVMFANGAVFRRSITDGTRTRWRHAAPSDPPTWAQGYVNLAGSGPEPMSLTHGPVLMEVTDDEATEAESGSFPRNVGLRYARVIDALDADPATAIPVGSVSDFLTEWASARAADDDDANAWVERHIHTAGSAGRHHPPHPPPGIRGSSPRPRSRAGARADRRARAGGAERR